MTDHRQPGASPALDTVYPSLGIGAIVGPRYARAWPIHIAHISRATLLHRGQDFGASSLLRLALADDHGHARDRGCFEDGADGQLDLKDAIDVGYDPRRQ